MAAAALPMLPRNIVLRNAASYTSFDAGRGCPFQCSFCTIIARPPVRNLERRQHVAFALGRDRQRLLGAQKIEDAIFQRAPFVFVKLGIAEVRLVEHRGFGGKDSGPA